MKDPRFWTTLDSLVSTCEITVDRPTGSCHPRYPDLVYPLDYGYLQGSQSSDGAEADCWVGSIAGRPVTGIVVTIDLQKRDAEAKVLLGCTPGEMQTIEAFHNGGPMAAIVMPRPERRPACLADEAAKLNPREKQELA
jgi:inorganic pyrophosphatase